MSYSDIMKMQREAEDRAREMNSRASKSEEPVFSECRDKSNCAIQKSLDDDRLLILALLLILSKNSNDRMIMLALLYILM